MEKPILANKNKVTVRPLPALTIKVDPPGDDKPERYYMLAKDQLVSILLIDDGRAQVFRGRVETFTGIYPDDVTVTLDISKEGSAEMVSFHVKFIQEINPIDWTYPVLDPCLVPTPYAYWDERDGYGIAPVTTRVKPEGWE